MTYLLGRDVVTPFQIETLPERAHGRRAGAALDHAGAGRPLRRRGHVPRLPLPGLGADAAHVRPAIVVISAAWAVIHVQYDWFGILQIFLTGLFFGWVRWRSGSTLLTFVLHGLMNAWATVETIVKLNWLRL